LIQNLLMLSSSSSVFMASGFEQKVDDLCEARASFSHLIGEVRRLLVGR
jgi:hypothetical protein